MFHGTIPVERPADAHDVLGTWRIVSDAAEMQLVPTSSERFVEILKRRHAVVMAGPTRTPSRRIQAWVQSSRVHRLRLSGFGARDAGDGVRTLPQLGQTLRPRRVRPLPDRRDSPVRRRQRAHGTDRDERRAYGRGRGADHHTHGLSGQLYFGAQGALAERQAGRIDPRAGLRTAVDGRHQLEVGRSCEAGNSPSATRSWTPVLPGTRASVCGCRDRRPDCEGPSYRVGTPSRVMAALKIPNRPLARHQARSHRETELLRAVRAPALPEDKHDRAQKRSPRSRTPAR